MSNVTRLLGCVAAVWLLGAGVGSASTISLDAFSLAHSGSASLGTADQVDPQDITGTVNSHSALVYSKDWVEFHVTPSSGTSVSVDVLPKPGTISTPSFPSEFFKLVSGATISGLGTTATGGTLVTGPTAVTSASATTLFLTGGIEYFLELNSGTPSGLGQSQFALSTPLPGALVLFGSVLGLGGLLMRRRNKRDAVAPAAFV